MMWLTSNPDVAYSKPGSNNMVIMWLTSFASILGLNNVFMMWLTSNTDVAYLKIWSE